jgi:hypothetical protein
MIEICDVKMMGHGSPMVYIHMYGRRREDRGANCTIIATGRADMKVREGVSPP